MNLKRMAGAAVLAAGIGIGGLLGTGIGTASANPGPPCDAPNAPCQPAPPGPNDWQHRDINQARGDHQPFMYNGQRVEPTPAGNGDGWGFWFLGRWMPL